MRFSRKQKYSSQSDEHLMTLVGRGEIPAFDELYGRYGKRLLYYFYKMLAQDEQKAQDFLHDLFLKIVERPELFSPDRRFSTWVFSIAHNMCKNEYRKFQTRSTVALEFDEMPFDSDDLIEAIDRESFGRILSLELDALDEEHRTTFLLRYREQFSIKEIGDLLGCAEGTVKSRLYYTAKKLAVRLKNFNPNVSSLVL
jgi:RNA polymerase sigma-70 factor (ECF subfamily)